MGGTIMMEPKWMDPATAAELVQVSERILKGWLRQGLPHAKVSNKIIRISPADLDEFMTTHVVVVGNPKENSGGLREDEKKQIDRIVNGLLS
jgi:hypothetical protein